MSGARLLGFGFLLALASNFGQTFFIGLFSQPLREALQLSNSGFGLIYSGATLLSALLLLWSGGWVDRMPLARVTALSFLGLALGSVLLSLSGWHVGLLFVGMLCLRQFGQGLLGHISAAVMSRSFSGARGRALSIAALGYPAGEALLPSLAILALASLGWQLSWLLIGLLLLLMLPLCLLLLPSQPYQTASASVADVVAVQPRHWQRVEVLRDGPFWLLMPLLSAPALVITGLFFHQSAIAAAKGWSLQQLAASFALHAALQTLASIVSGILIDRYSGRLLGRIYLLPMIAAALVLALAQSQLALWLYMGLLGVTAGAMFPVFVAILSEIYGVGHIGSIKAVVMALLTLSSALAPVLVLVGGLLDLGWTVEAIALAAVVYTVVAMALGNLSLVQIQQRLKHQSG